MRPPRPLDLNTQAGRIISKFGGITACWKAMQKVSTDRRAVPSAPAILYRWTYPVSKHGTGGLIPAASVHVILAAAEAEGITLTPEDWYPSTVTE